MEEVGLRLPLAQHLAGRYTHTVETTASQAPVQDEQRKTWAGTPAARQRAMVERLPLFSAQLRQRESRNRGEKENLIGELKGQGCPFLYRLPGGANLASQAMWDYPPLPGAAQEGAPALGGPHLAHLGRPSLSHKIPL